MKTPTRYFNTSGPNIRERHYTLERPKLIQEGLSLVHGERYFTIWAPRQTGKSTYFRMLAEVLEQEGYKVCHINLENFKDVAEKLLCQHLSRELTKAWGITIDVDSFSELFVAIIAINDRQCVFIIDEIEGLNPDLFNQFLHTIRNAYHSRTTHCLKSVILVGVSNITGIIQDNASPFNIADNLEIAYFTKEEVFELLAMHEHESEQQFAPNVKEKIYSITTGQPGLVNGFGYKLVEKHPQKPLINYEDYLDIEENYIRIYPDKNISNIINKGIKHQLFLESLLFNEKKIPFQTYDARIRELAANGLIASDEDRNIIFKVPLYKKCLQQFFYPRLNGESNQIQKNIDTDDYFTTEGKLKLDTIIRNYQTYAKKRGFRYFIEKDEQGNPKNLKEAALMYSFETFIQSFLQVLEGKSYLEAHVALGRSDLIINVRGQEFVIEGKVYQNITQFTKGKTQLAYYVKSLNLRSGVYLVFVQNDVTHPKVLEAVETIEGVEITTYLVYYDLDLDFSEPK